ncbi:MAG: DMT family transporter [Actinobacteria bacterium]|nr:DMT family transporter [Actinomycetota bacterium]
MSRILSTSEGTHRGTFTPLDWTLFLAIGGIWGSSFILIATGLDAFRPGLVTWLRVGSGAAVLWLSPNARPPIEREDRPRLVALSILWVGIPFTLFPLAQQHVESAAAGMLNGGLPIVATLVASVMLRRVPAPVQILGLVLGSAGVAVIALSTAGEGGSEAFGVLLLLGAVLCYGFAINIAAPLQQRYGSLRVMARMLALASLWTAPFGLASIPGSRLKWGPLAAVLALGAIGTGVAFVCMGMLVGRVGSTRASFATYLIPVVAMVLGVVVLGERVAAIAMAGVAAVIAGAMLASRREA